MSTPKFTPGPWLIDKFGNLCTKVSEDGSMARESDIEISMLGVSFTPKGAGIPNRNLVAAAPDLYAALEEMIAGAQPTLVKMGEPGSIPFPLRYSPKVEMAMAALAKARGEA